MKRILIFLILILAAAGGIYYWNLPSVKAPAIDLRPVIETRTNDFVLLEPAPYDKVTSPLTVVGEATGLWYFEGSFPIEVQDLNGKKLGGGIAQAQGEWMTADFVPFKSVIEFTATSGPLKLVPRRDNPSGLPENEYQLEFPLEY